MIYALQIAIRFLKHSKIQTMLIAVGIGVGVSVQLFIGQLISGLQSSLIDKTIGNSSHITITSSVKNEGIQDYEQIIATLKQNADFTVVAPVMQGSAFLMNEQGSEPVYIRGFEFEQSASIYEFTERLIEGRLPQASNEVLVGSNLKDNLSLSLNQSITVTIATGEQTTLTIVGIFDFKVASINEGWILSDLSTAQTIFHYDQQISAIETQVNRIFKAEDTALEVQNSINKDDLSVESWITANESLLSGLNGQSISSYMIQVFVLISVVLGIASILAITVLQKSKQLGILKAMGLSNQKASLVFLFEGLILGVLGALIGVVMGVGLLVSFTTFAVNADGTPVVPITMDGMFILFSSLVAIGSALLASLIPAIRSSKLNPIEVIRNG